MSATFSLTPEDFRLFQRATALRYRALHGRLGIPFVLQVFAWLCAGLSTTAFFRLWQQDPDAARPYGVLGLILLVAFVSAVALPYAAQWSFKRRAVTPGGAFLAPQTVALTTDGLVFTSAVAKSELSWKSVLGRVEDHRNHYLFIDTAHAVVVPKAIAAELGGAFSEKLLTIHLAV